MIIMSEAYSINIPEPSPHLPATDERTLAKKPATRLWWTDAPPEKQHFYYRLNRHNEDAYRRADTKIWKDADDGFNEVLIDSITGRIGFDSVLRDEATWKYNLIDKRRTGRKCELVAFVVCMRVADRVAGGKNFATYHPQRKEGNAVAFVELADWLEDSFNIPKDHIIKVYNKYPSLPRKLGDPLLYKPLHNSTLEDNSELETKYSLLLEDNENPANYRIGELEEY